MVERRVVRRGGRRSGSRTACLLVLVPNRVRLHPFLFRSPAFELTLFRSLVNEFIPPRALGPESTNLLPPAPIGNGLTSAPLTRQPTEVNGNNAAQPISEATLEMWQDTVGMIVANRTAGDSAALTALGDVLASNGWVAAAHVWFVSVPSPL